VKKERTIKSLTSRIKSYGNMKENNVFNLFQIHKGFQKYTVKEIQFCILNTLTKKYCAMKECIPVAKNNNHFTSSLKIY